MDEFGKTEALGGSEQFGVIKTFNNCWFEVMGKDNGSGYDWSSKGATADFVNTGDVGKRLVPEGGLKVEMRQVHTRAPAGSRRLSRKLTTGVIRLMAGETPLMGIIRRIRIMVP